MDIVLVDDHEIFTDALEILLNKTPGHNVVNKFNTAKYALSWLQKHTADYIITDYSMPNMDGLMLSEALKKQHPSIKIIVLTMQDEPEKTKAMLAVDIDGYILKKYAKEELLKAIEIIENGGKYCSPEINTILMNSASKPKNDVAFSERELEILNLIYKEYTTRQIAEELFLSIRTIDAHRRNLLAKTDTTNTVGLIKYAYKHHLLKDKKS